MNQKIQSLFSIFRSGDAHFTPCTPASVPPNTPNDAALLWLATIVRYPRAFLMIAMLLTTLIFPVRAVAGSPSQVPKEAEAMTDSSHAVPHSDPTSKPLSQGTAAHIAAVLRRSGWPDGLIVFTMAMLPIVELRGAVPAGFMMGMNPWKVYLLAVAGNMVPMPFILLFLGPISSVAMRCRPGKVFFEWLFARTRRKTANIEKYETLGLTVFVAIPLPVTGGWTGAMAAFLLGLKFHHAMISILLGVMIAGIIMTLLSLMGWVGAAIAGLVLLALTVGSLMGYLRGEEKKADNSN